MKAKAVIGIVLGIFGVLSFAGGAALGLKTNDQLASDSLKIDRAETACQAQLIKLGRVIPAENNVIEFQLNADEGETSIVDPRRAMADATAILAMCPGRELLEACIGVDCGVGAPGPVRMTLKLGLID